MLVYVYINEQWNFLNSKVARKWRNTCPNNPVCLDLMYSVTTVSLYFQLLFLTYPTCHSNHRSIKISTGPTPSPPLKSHTKTNLHYPAGLGGRRERKLEKERKRNGNLWVKAEGVWITKNRIVEEEESPAKEISQATCFFS